MNLAEGEFIANIDEGWWTSIGPGGKTGLFPSNYVEVVHQPETHEEEPAEVDTASATTTTLTSGCICCTSCTSCTSASDYTTSCF